MNEISIDSKLSASKLVSNITVSDGLKKYFNSFRLFAHYDSQLRADTSILNIPLVSTVLPLAWLTGTDVYVEKLDKRYVESMNAVKHEFKRMYPRGRFTTSLVVDDLVNNETQSQRTAMLFTGGVDSTYSLIKNINHKPRLIMFWGIQPHQLNPSYMKHRQLVRKTYSDFAEQRGLEINFIDTNTYGILNDIRISHDFHKIILGAGLWLSLQFPLVLLGLPAPLSIGRFNRLLIAASVDPMHEYDKYPHSSQPRIDEKFAWADLEVIHDGYIHRFGKTSLIKKYSTKNELHITVCNAPPPNRFNCSSCEKCFRTITQLILEGIDPNNVGFDVNRTTFAKIKYILEREKLDPLLANSFWRILQTLIPQEIKTNFYGSRSFFTWLKDLDIDLCRKGRDLHRGLFNLLPYPLAQLFDASYYSMHKRLFNH